MRLHDGDAMSMPLNITTLVLYDITNQAIDFTDTIHTLQSAGESRLKVRAKEKQFARADCIFPNQFTPMYK